jgi:hypothetical protein
MCSDPHDQNDLVRVADFHIQTVTVPFQLEDDAIVGRETRCDVSCLDVVRRLPFRFFDFTNPRVNVGTRVGVSLFEIIQNPFSMNLHGRTPLHAPFMGPLQMFPAWDYSIGALLAGQVQE